MTTQHHQKLHLMISRFFLLVSGTQSRLLPPQVPPPFKYEFELYLNPKPLTSPNPRSLLLTTPQIVDLPLKLDSGQLPMSIYI